MIPQYFFKNTAIAFHWKNHSQNNWATKLAQTVGIFFSQSWLDLAQRELKLLLPITLYERNLDNMLHSKITLMTLQISALLSDLKKKKFLSVPLLCSRKIIYFFSSSLPVNSDEGAYRCDDMNRQKEKYNTRKKVQTHEIENQNISSSSEAGQSRKRVRLLLSCKKLKVIQFYFIIELLDGVHTMCENRGGSIWARRWWRLL